MTVNVQLVVHADTQALLVNTPEQVPADHPMVIEGMVGPGAWLWTYGHLVGKLIDAPSVQCTPVMRNGRVTGFEGYYSVAVADPRPALVDGRDGC